LIMDGTLPVAQTDELVIAHFACLNYSRNQMPLRILI